MVEQKLTNMGCVPVSYGSSWTKLVDEVERDGMWRLCHMPDGERQGGQAQGSAGHRCRLHTELSRRSSATWGQQWGLGFRV